jgi:hypothetical protein
MNQYRFEYMYRVSDILNLKRMNNEISWNKNYYEIKS